MHIKVYYKDRMVHESDFQSGDIQDMTEDVKEVLWDILERLPEGFGDRDHVYDFVSRSAGYDLYIDKVVIITNKLSKLKQNNKHTSLPYFVQAEWETICNEKARIVQLWWRELKAFSCVCFVFVFLKVRW